MRLCRKLSLKARLTLLSSLIMVSVVLLFTAMSMYSADKIFVSEAKTISITFTNDTETDADLEKVTIAQEVEMEAKKTDAISQDEGQERVAIKMVPLDFIVTANDQFRSANYIVMAILILAGACLTYIVTGKTLRAVGKISTQMHNINENNLFLRVEEKNLSPEIERMTDAFNHMMGRLENAFAAQKKFAAAAAHELKTPLACINTTIEVLQLEDKPVLEDYEKTLDVIKRNTDRLIALTEELLDINRNYDDSSRFSIKEICQEIGRELTFLLERKKVRLEMIGDAEMEGSYQAVYRIFFNLVENAVKYNRENGSVLIEINREKETISVCVKDTGIGMNEDEIIHIFEPFYRVDKSRNRRIGGAGLGLSIVHDLVDKCKGKIVVKSQKGRGSSFCVTFVSKG